MALASTMVFEIRQGGADTNGGGFNAARGGTDYTLQNSPLINVADGVTTSGSAVVTSATANFPADCVGNMISISGASAFFEIISRASATSITVDRTTGLTTTSGLTLIVGGAWATPGRVSTIGAAGWLVSGQKAWVKYSATPYSLTTTTAGNAGPCSIVTGIAFTVEGYDVTRGDRTGNRATYQWTVSPGATAYAFVGIANTAKQIFANLAVDGNAQANAGGFQFTNPRGHCADCYAANCSAAGGVGFQASNNTLVRCGAFNCLTGFSGASNYVQCDANANSLGSSTGFTGAVSAAKCLARNATTGFTAGGVNVSVANCTADTCGTGFASTTTGVFDSCLATNCTTVGFAAGGSINALHSCAAYNNLANVSGTPLLNEGPFASASTLTSLSGDPYVNRAGGDFRPNGTAGAGLSLWAAGFDVFGQTAQQDIGACQHADPAGAAGILVYRGLNGGLSG